MGKRRKLWRKRRHRVRPCNSSNRHHLIFQGRHWNTGYAKMLREHFVRPLNVALHNELHNEIVHDIPRPTDAEIKALWLKYVDDQERIDALDIKEACKWLFLECDDPAWQACMARQYYFLSERL